MARKEFALRDKPMSHGSAESGLSKYIAFVGLSLCTTLSVAVVVLNESGSQGGYWTLLGFGYTIFYLYFLYASQIQPTIFETFLLFLFQKVCLLTFFIATNYFSSLLPHAQGDPTAYHMPTAIGFYESGDFIDYLIFSDIYNGKMTHLLLMGQVWLLDILGYDYTDMGILGASAFFFNLILLTAAIIIFYRAILIFSRSENYARRFVWFVALHPIFISNTSAAKKEALLFLAVALFFYYLFAKSKKGWLAGVLSIVILFFDRVYMIPLLGLIALLQLNDFKSKDYIFIIALGLIFLLFTDIPQFLEMIRSHQQSLTSAGIDGSFFRGEHGIIANAFRALFSPLPYRNFSLETGPDIAFDMAIPYIYIFLYLPVVLYSFLNCRGVERAFLVTLIFCFVFIPFHSTFKLFMFVCVGGFLIEKISAVKYKLNN